MSPGSLIEFGGKRALADSPDSTEPILLLLASLVRAVIAKPLVDLDNKTIVLRRKKIPFNIIDVAKLEVSTDIGGRAVGLRFGIADGPQVVVQLRRGGSLVQSPYHRAIVLVMLIDSQITMPTSPYDPTGRHSRWNFPTHLTKEQAIEVVTDPPGPRDLLPIPPVS
jgi:hypothetical protein